LSAAQPDPPHRWTLFPHGVDDRHLPQTNPRRRPPATHLQGLVPNSDPLHPADGLDLPELDPLLCFHSLGLFSARLGTAFAAPPLTTLACSAHSALRRWSPACRSTLDLMICPQTTFPSEISRPALAPDRSRMIQRGPTYQAARYDRRTVASICRRRATPPAGVIPVICKFRIRKGNVATPGHPCGQVEVTLCGYMKARPVVDDLADGRLISGQCFPECRGLSRLAPSRSTGQNFFANRASFRARPSDGPASRSSASATPCGPRPKMETATRPGWASRRKCVRRP